MSAHHSLVSEMANEQKKHLKNLAVTPESRTFALAKLKWLAYEKILCTLSGVRTLDPLIKSQLLYQLS